MLFGLRGGLGRTKRKEDYKEVVTLTDRKKRGPPERGDARGKSRSGKRQPDLQRIGLL